MDHFKPTSEAQQVILAPLSFAQKEVWYMSQIEREKPGYNAPFGLLFEGNLDYLALEVAVNQLIERHEGLRTRFLVVEDQPMQEVLPFTRQSIPLQDLLMEQGKSLKQSLTDWYAINGTRHRLDQTPPLKITLLRISPSEHVLIMDIHHILTDGSANRIFVQDFIALYKSAVLQEDSGLPPVAIPYHEYAIDEQSHPERWQSLLEKWKQTYSPPPDLELPFDFPRPYTINQFGADFIETLDKDLTQDLMALTEKAGCTIFMTLSTILQVLLYRYTGQRSFGLGMPMSGRTKLEYEEIGGIMRNSIPLNIRIDPALSFSARLQLVRREILNCLQYQRVPFEKMVQAVIPDRDRLDNRLYSVITQYQNRMPPVQLPGGLVMSRISLDHIFTFFDLRYDFFKDGKDIGYRLIYSTELFKEAFIKRLAAHFVQLAKSIVQNPEVPIGRLNMLLPEEFQQVVVDWNNTRTGYPRDASVQEVFTQVAAKYPDESALDYPAETLTYADLEARANKLAQHLIRLGIKPGEHVGICLPPSTDRVTSALAVLKAGGVYVPLESNLPAARMAFLVQNAGLKAVITSRAWASNFAHLVDVVISDLEGVYAGAPAVAPDIKVTGEHPAYIVYTSGSTGQPKAMVLPHRGITRLVLNTNYLQVEPGDRVAFVSSFMFDATTFQMWGPLLNGGTVVGFGQDALLSPAEFLREVRERKVNVLMLTASLFHQYAREHPDQFNGLKALLPVGEVLDPRYARLVLEKSSPGVMINGYGPSENTTFSACYRFTALNPNAETVPIGKPVANSTCYVLDENMQPLPTGIFGELYVGGDGLSLGYLNRPDLTAERFVPHPFSAEPDAKLYRTGDRVRWLPDGNLDFGGRLDTQVKIRGFRVELEEIDAALLKYPAVHLCQTLALPDPAGSSQLVSFFMAKPGQANVDILQLRHYLSEQLPNYMVPSRLVELAQMPLNISGKINRSALLETPEYQAGAAPVETSYTAPRDDLERTIAGIWEDVLQRKSIGIDDNFFELGGHSLTAIQLVVKMESLMGSQMPISALYRTPTVRGLAAFLRESGRGSASAAEGSILRIPVFGVGNPANYGLLGSHLDPQFELYQLSLPDVLLKPLDAGAAEHIQQIKAIQPHGPYRIFGWSFGGLMVYEIARQLAESGDEVAFLGIVDTSPILFPNMRTDLPGWVQKRYYFEWLIWAAGFHFREIAKLSIIDRLGYINKRLKKRLKWLPLVFKQKEYTQREQAEVIFTNKPAIQQYHPKIYNGDAHLFRVKQQRTTLVRQKFSFWNYLVKGTITLHQIPGTHLTLLKEGNVETLAALMSEAMKPE